MPTDKMTKLCVSQMSFFSPQRGAIKAPRCIRKLKQYALAFRRLFLGRIFKGLMAELLN